MALIATNHLMLILEVAILIHIGVLLILNFLPLSFSLIFLLSLILGVGITLLFGVDAICLLLPMLSHHEFTHPYGPIAILVVVTSWAILPMLRDQNIKTSNIRLLIILITAGITIFGAIVHRDFLLMWVLGLVIGFFILSKTFRRENSILSARRILLIIVALFVVFGAMEGLSQLLHMEIISPLARIDRMNTNQFASLQLVIDNTNVLGHNANATYWGNASTGNSDGYISLPLTFITYFGLPFPLFYGILVTRKDVIDYFLPGIFGVGFDFGYLALALIIIWILIVIIVGLKVLDKYRVQRERGNKKYLGREALLIGSLSAFIAQTVLGFFVITRTINGSALVTYLFLSAMVMAHIVTTKR
ncbi:MAG: hypothetical protein ACI4VJ_06280 [Methanosphaera sp.]|jgi:hypothetical protein|uniref:hypothetical protein n=1 Tax=Methanosphaera TaxID=2316 RepID=UPI0023807EF9|nr:hypothetical protein [Candidatus Methanosphaera massiliense]MDD6286215.1 hypothetical protein [Methanobacteriaceae archaeon]MDE4077620.1 hypothetical protein [Candidatus Methanosphaera massiliense]